jgi:hypothetical protein
LRGRLAAGAGVVLAASGLFVAYLHLARTTSVNSDGAAVALQAWDVLHGNWLLHGWRTADVSFYPTEVPQHALAEAVSGLSPDVVHVCAALTWTLIVLLTASLGVGPRAKPGGALRAVVAGTIVVAPSAGWPTHVLLFSPDHTGTAVPVMLTLLFLDRARAARWVPLAVLALLTWMQVADELAAVAAAAPLALVGVVRLAGGGRADGSRWYDGWLAVAALASIGLTPLVLRGIHAIGGFYQPPLSQTAVNQRLFASPSTIPQHAGALGEGVRILFSVSGVAGNGWFTTATLGPHLILLAVSLLALLSGMGRFLRLDRVTQTLVAGIVAVLIAGALGSFLTGPGETHDVAVLLPMSAALAGRMLPARLLAPGRRTVLFSAAIAAILGWLLAALGLAAAADSVPAGNQQLAEWLLAQNLTSGLAGYWDSDSISLDSGGRIRMAAVQVRPAGGLRPYRWESVDSWYDPRVSRANFVITAQDPAAGLVIPEQALTSWFGRPVRVHHAGQFTISVWNKNLLTRLGPLPGLLGRAGAFGQHEELLAQQLPYDGPAQVEPGHPRGRRKGAAERVGQEPGCHRGELEAGRDQMLGCRDVGQDQGMVRAVEVRLRAEPEVGAHHGQPPAGVERGEQLAQDAGDGIHVGQVLEEVGHEDGVEVVLGQIGVQDVRDDHLYAGIGEVRVLDRVDGPALLGRDHGDEFAPARRGIKDGFR